MRPFLHAAALTLLVSAGALAQGSDAGTPSVADAPVTSVPLPTGDVSDVIKAPRPRGGEWMGLYLVDKKVGYVFEDLRGVKGQPHQVESINELVFKASVGSQVSNREHKESRIYEAKPNGRLLSFTIEDHGDGGDQVLSGKRVGQKFVITRKRPKVADEQLSIPVVNETVEVADPIRTALLRKKPLQLTTLDGTDLSHWGVKVTLGATEKRTLNAVPVTLSKVIVVEEKDKTPQEALVTADGDVVELTMAGGTLRAHAEPASVARRMDQVEIFGLTRVVLPKPLPQDVRKVPNQISLVLDGFPEKFAKDTFRQSFSKLPQDRVLVTLKAVKLAGKPAARPLAKSPTLAPYLATSIVVESDNKDIKALAKKIAAAPLTVNDNSVPWVKTPEGELVPARVTLPAGGDAYNVAKKIVGWVSANMKKDYGASADRATDVLRQMKGDCTEHSLLSESLLRAAGIPAKRVDGVVYLVNADGVPAFYWHEWVEAFVGEWTQMDPTFDEMVADAGHFAVGEESNAEITPLLGHLKVVEVK